MTRRKVQQVTNEMAHKQQQASTPQRRMPRVTEQRLEANTYTEEVTQKRNRSKIEPYICCQIRSTVKDVLPGSRHHNDQVALWQVNTKFGFVFILLTNLAIQSCFNVTKT